MINIETMRIILALEAAAEEHRIRVEAQIWNDINILIISIQT